MFLLIILSLLFFQLILLILIKSFLLAYKDQEIISYKIRLFAINIAFNPLNSQQNTANRHLELNFANFLTAKRHARHGVWDNIELVPNIILNPGFNESGDDEQQGPYTRTILFGRTGGIACPRIIATGTNGSDDEEGNSGASSDSGDRSSVSSLSSDHEPKMQKFKRKLSVFFTDPTIKRI